MAGPEEVAPQGSEEVAERLGGRAWYRWDGRKYSLVLHPEAHWAPADSWSGRGLEWGGLRPKETVM